MRSKTNPAVIDAQVKDLGGFSVGRVLPAKEFSMVGPWIFFDHMGPANLSAESKFDVRPHPHINLATVTYLFEGEILHKDSLGNAAVGNSGAVPEPHEWLLIGLMIAMVFIKFYRR